ncbi:MAG: hypothetical protein BGO57_14850 [Sphingomonadales bacterium 63-6]|nr:MAG: hypothetical protein BGO57_14850 [Sphingomonadales bacterium 63-6]
MADFRKRQGRTCVFQQLQLIDTRRMRVKKLIVFVAGALLAGPAWASEAPTDQAAPSANKPQTCEMMHDGMKMQGMMVKDKDGKMTCRMMDQPHMDHGKMHHGDNPQGQSAHDQHPPQAPQ